MYSTVSAPMGKKRQENDPVTKPIFVVGPPRSGTTLTGRILGRHPEVFLLGESNFFEDIWTRRDEIGALSTPDAVEIIADRLATLFGRYYEPTTQALVEKVWSPDPIADMVLECGDNYGDLYLSFMGRIARDRFAHFVCDGTPKHLFYLEDIFELLPDAKAIICVRDIRDFLTSYKNWWKRSPSKERIKALYHPILTASLWRSSTNIALSSLTKFSSEQVLLLRYEDLVTQPNVQVKRMCDFLRIDYADDLLNLDKHNSSYEGSSTGIFSSSIGRWNEGLEAEEVWLAQRIARGNMESLSYAPVPVKPSYGKLVRIVISLPYVFWTAMRANAKHRGPTWKYLARRIQHLFRG